MNAKETLLFIAEIEIFRYSFYSRYVDMVTSGSSYDLKTLFRKHLNTKKPREFLAKLKKYSSTVQYSMHLQGLDWVLKALWDQNDSSVIHLEWILLSLITYWEEHDI